MIVWMLVSEDKYELPLAVEDSCVELAKRLHIHRDTVFKAIQTAKAKGERCRFVKVEIDE